MNIISWLLQHSSKRGHFYNELELFRKPFDFHMKDILFCLFCLIFIYEIMPIKITGHLLDEFFDRFSSKMITALIRNNLDQHDVLLFRKFSLLL